jgi:diguanylate cyclase (GGDEF)-like protein
MVAARSAPKLSSAEREHGIPIFLDQVIKTLSIARLSRPFSVLPASNDSDSGADPEVIAVATLHGRHLFEQGFTIEQVIRDYGDVCQAVTTLAVEIGAPIRVDEFRTFNRCLDDAIAGAATEYSKRQRNESIKASVPGVKPIPHSGDDLEQLETALTDTQTALANSEAALSVAQRDAHTARVRALHDSLTGLPNRELFDDRLTHAIALADRHTWTLAVMFLDLNRFKIINDNHGHAAGDLVLKTIADRLLRYVRDEDTVCRNGGDEFLYLLMNPRGRKNVEHIAESVLMSIAQPVALGELRFIIKPSIGVALYPANGISGSELITNADSAMYHAKKRSRGVVFFGRQKTAEITV